MHERGEFLAGPRGLLSIKGQAEGFERGEEMEAKLVFVRVGGQGGGLCGEEVDEAQGVFGEVEGLRGAEEGGRVLGGGAIQGGEGAEGVFLVEELGVQFLEGRGGGVRRIEGRTAREGQAHTATRGGGSCEGGRRLGSGEKGDGCTTKGHHHHHHYTVTYVQILRCACGEVQDVAQRVFQDGHGCSLAPFLGRAVGLCEGEENYWGESVRTRCKQAGAASDDRCEGTRGAAAGAWMLVRWVCCDRGRGGRKKNALFLGHCLPLCLCPPPRRRQAPLASSPAVPVLYAVLVWLEACEGQRQKEAKRCCLAKASLETSMPSLITSHSHASPLQHNDNNNHRHN